MEQTFSGDMHTVRTEIITELIQERAGPISFKTFLLKLIAFRLISVICPARRAKPEKLLEMIINSRQGPSRNKTNSRKHFSGSAIILVPTVSRRWDQKEEGMDTVVAKALTIYRIARDHQRIGEQMSKNTEKEKPNRK